MYLPSSTINSLLSAAEIVGKDYRAAEIFRRYDIGYCCGLRLPLSVVCEVQHINENQLLLELNNALRNAVISNELDFHNWSIDFLLDYIINVHHQYLRKSLPQCRLALEKFANEHRKKYTFLEELVQQFDLLINELFVAMHKEEQVFFPYLRRLAHAREDKETYGSLLVKTLREPVEETMSNSHASIENLLETLRYFTNNYTAPGNACTSHVVNWAKLKELDNDLLQHQYLENFILFPKVNALEKELLKEVSAY